MKVLFLDIDGVLNRKNTTEKIYLNKEAFIGVDQSLLKRYMDWLYDKDVEVVLSSDWRRLEVSMEYLNDLGVFWHSTTPMSGYRGDEINFWLKNYNHEEDITHVAILDDTQAMKPVGKYLVQTSGCLGLQDKHLKKLNKLLNYE